MRVALLLPPPAAQYGYPRAIPQQAYPQQQAMRRTRLPQDQATADQAIRSRPCDSSTRRLLIPAIRPARNPRRRLHLDARLLGLGSRLATTGSTAPGLLPPYDNALWTPGWWGYGGRGYFWNAGYWGPAVGYYGGINYGFGYFGVGFYGGYWNGGRFWYNRAYNHFGHGFRRRFYERRYAGFNGRPGGPAFNSHPPMQFIGRNGQGGFNHGSPMNGVSRGIPVNAGRAVDNHGFENRGFENHGGDNRNGQQQPSTAIAASCITPTAATAQTRQSLRRACDGSAYASKASQGSPRTYAPQQAQAPRSYAAPAQQQAPRQLLQRLAAMRSSDAAVGSAQLLARPAVAVDTPAAVTSARRQWWRKLPRRRRRSSLIAS